MYLLGSKLKMDMEVVFFNYINVVILKMLAKFPRS